MKRILMLMNSFNVGGVTNVVLAIYNGLDKEKYSIDFIRDARYQENEIEKSIKDNGSEVFYFNKPRISKIPLLNYRIQHKKWLKNFWLKLEK